MCSPVPRCGNVALTVSAYEGLGAKLEAAGFILMASADLESSFHAEMALSGVASKGWRSRLDVVR